MNNPVRPADPDAIREAAGLLRAGALVAFPTETVYGLGACALDIRAVGRIFAAKGRPPDNPLIIHVSCLDDITPEVASVPEVAKQLAARWWPGPLTLVMPRGPRVPDIVTAGLATVAVRVPAHPVALELLRAVGAPVAAPSANRSGRPSPTQAQHVADDLGDRVAMILDGGATQVGIESTVLDVTSDRPMILRRGSVTLADLESCLGVGAVDSVNIHKDREAARRSPGLRHRHYAPTASVTLCQPKTAEALASEALRRGEIVAVLIRGEVGQTTLCLPERLDKERTNRVLMPHAAIDYARELFGCLRALDRLGAGALFIEEVPRDGLGGPIMDRLERAAEGSGQPR